MAKQPHETNFDRRIGMCIRAARSMQGLSAYDLANRLDPPLRFQKLLKYEQGTHSVPLWRIVQIAKALGLPLGQLLGEPISQDNSPPTAPIASHAKRTSTHETLCSCVSLDLLSHKVWSVDDVLALRPDLTQTEAMEVLLHAWTRFAVFPDFTEDEMRAIAFCIFGAESSC